MADRTPKVVLNETPRCTGDKHVWPAWPTDRADGNTCNCGRFCALVGKHYELVIEEADFHG
jgi:hypothetical protein